MTDLQPEKDMANALVAATSVFNPPLALDTDIKCSVPRSPLGPGNTATIWLMPYGGAEPDPLVDAAAQGSIFRSKVQVIVRSPAEQYDAGLAKARKVRRAIHTRQTSGYISWRALTSEPQYLGIDEAQEHKWAVNFEACWCDADS